MLGCYLFYFEFELVYFFYRWWLLMWIRRWCIESPILSCKVAVHSCRPIFFMCVCSILNWYKYLNSFHFKNFVREKKYIFVFEANERKINSFNERKKYQIYEVDIVVQSVNLAQAASTLSYSQYAHICVYLRACVFVPVCVCMSVCSWSDSSICIIA